MLIRVGRNVATDTRLRGERRWSGGPVRDAGLETRNTDKGSGEVTTVLLRLFGLLRGDYDKGEPDVLLRSCARLKEAPSWGIGASLRAETG